MSQITTPISIRLSRAELDFLGELGEAQSLSPGQAARQIIQLAMTEGRDLKRLTALENRLVAIIQKIPEQTADLLTKEYKPPCANAANIKDHPGISQKAFS